MSMPSHFTVGLDFGTNSARALIVDVADGREVGHGVSVYASGKAGILTDDGDANVARQQPSDYLASMEAAVAEALATAREDAEFEAGTVVGIGIDATASTPIPVDSTGQPLAMHPRFTDDLNAMAWLWKDHTSHEEAALITAKARELRPEFLAKCGGTYSSEWFWAKVLHCARVAPDVFDRAYTWVELADWIPAILTGTTDPQIITRCVCAAGHKGLYSTQWGGFPDADFLAAVDDRLVRVGRSMKGEAKSIAHSVGHLSPQWSSRLKLPPGIPVAAGSIDAHMGAVGSGVRPGTMVKIIGTSACDIGVAPMDPAVPDIEGICGIVPESVLPGLVGIEAGQAAVGDLFNWFVEVMQPQGATHESLTKEAAALKPGESGLLALDWFNGNRNVLADPRLSGMILGMSLSTRPAEVYRALIEATAFGARVILERLRDNGVEVSRIVCGGGIARKNPMLMQIYADVLNCRLEIAASEQACALGSAMAASVVAGEHADFAAATSAMTRVLPEAFEPNVGNRHVYDELYAQWIALHDAFGEGELGGVMKDLMKVRDGVKENA